MIDPNSSTKAVDAFNEAVDNDPNRRLQDVLAKPMTDTAARILSYVPSTGVAMNRPDTVAELLYVVARLGDRLTQALQEQAAEEEKHRALRNDVAAMRRLMSPSED